MNKTLPHFYDCMAAHFGPTHWWPGDTPFEIAVGAILTQNTAWTNVEKAIANLKREGLLDPRAMLACPRARLEMALVPSGYYRLKAGRVSSFCAYLVERYDGGMANMARQPLETLRPELLAVHGIGPETADDILLYACEKPVFVVDAYTRRLFSRHGIVAPDIGYEDLRAVFERRLPREVPLFKEYHGLIVWTGKDFCRRMPKCEACPLRALLKRGQPILG